MRGVRVAQQLAALARLVVREEDEPAGVDARSSTMRADGRPSGVGGRQGHGHGIERRALGGARKQA